MIGKWPRLQCLRSLQLLLQLGLCDLLLLFYFQTSCRIKNDLEVLVPMEILICSGP